MRTWLQRVHLMFGGILALPLIVLGLSGTVLVLADGGPSSGPPAAAGHRHHAQSAPVHSPSEIVGAAMRAAPAGAHPVRYQAGRGAVPARVTYSTSASEMSTTVMVDAATLAVSAAPPRANGLIGEIHALHENFLAGRGGRMFVGLLGAAMIVLCVTGPILWWPGRERVREALTFDARSRGFRLFRDVHRAVGMYTVVVVFAVSVTGTYIIFPDVVGRAIAVVLPARALWSNGTAPRSRAFDIDAAVLAARTSAGDGGDVLAVQFPRGDAALRVDLAHAGVRRDPAPITVLLDATSMRVIDVRDPLHFTPGERLIGTLRPLHEGQILGPVWRVVLAITGLLPLFFAVTGIAMWRIRRSRGVRGPRTSAADLSVRCVQNTSVRSDG